MRPLLALGLFLTSLPFLSAEDAYRFLLDGREIGGEVLPVLGPRKDVMVAGDVGKVADFPFVLGSPGTYHFRTSGESGSLLYLRIGVGAERCFGAREIPADPDKKTPATSPFTTLEAAARDGLRTLHYEKPPADLSAFRDPSTFLSLVKQADAPLPALPAELRYLHLRCDAPLTGDDLARLAGLHALLYLTVEQAEESAFPLTALQGCTALRNLDIKGGRISSPESLSALKALRFVKLRELDGLENVAWARTLPELRVFKIDGTAVADLRPLANSRNLRLLSANGTKAAQLPRLTELPSIRDIRLHSTPLAKNKKYLAPYRSKVSMLVKNWDPAIKGFEVRDTKVPPPENAVLFIGSSSIRMWNLKKSFPDHVTINRGFGGSELSDALRYFDRIVLPYRPKAILLYAGDNDIANGETAAQVVADFRSFAAKVRSRLPGTDLAFLPIKPSLARLGLWEEMKKANDAILALTTREKHLHYLDIATPMIGDGPQPRREYFLDDGLHLNEKGYQVWNAVVGPWLDAR